MSSAVFPQLRGLQWNVGRQPIFDTLTYGSSSGYEVRVSKYPDPKWLYKLEYNHLRNGYSNVDDLNTLLGFFLARQGSYDSFLVNLADLTLNAADGTTTGQSLTVDGNNFAPLVHSLGSSGVTETIYELHGVPVIKGNGSTIPLTGHNVNPASGHWSYWDASATRTYGGTSYPGVVIAFGSTPAAPVTADFSWYQRMRFEKDNAEFEAFMYQLYELQEVDLITARDL